MHFAACTNTDIDIFFFSLLFLLSLLRIPMLLFLDFKRPKAQQSHENPVLEMAPERKNKVGSGRGGGVGDN